jgi:hypothetical protein
MLIGLDISDLKTQIIAMACLLSGLALGRLQELATQLVKANLSSVDGSTL